MTIPAALLLATLGAGDFMKGMTVSCPGYGKIWGSPSMATATREIKSLGVDWIAIHPYGSVKRDGSVRFQNPLHTEYMQRAVSITRKEKLKVFWKPHLAYWGSFKWRGEIDFGSDQAAWSRFFREYEAFIVAHARFAEQKKIPLFSVGLEYERTLHHEQAWRRIIQAVRKVYSGQITYATNWDSFERVPFWDAVDLIGVQGYFPISPENLDGSWNKILEQVTRVSKKNGQRKVLFTEIGYPRSKDAASKPWQAAVDSSPQAIELRSRLMEVAIRRLRHPLVAGAFWWKWIPGRAFWDRDFSMKDPEARAILGKTWGSTAQK